MTEFTVIISLHKSDRADWFYQAATSVLEQTCPPSNMLVTVDGGLLPEHEDALASIKARYKSVAICEVRRDATGSRGVLLGEAMKECPTELVAIMDADDLALKQRFERQLEVFSKFPELDVLGCWVEEISPKDDNYLKTRTVPSEHNDILSYAKYRNPINNMTVMFKRDVVLDAGNYQGMPNFADYWLWVRMLCTGATFKNLPEVLVRARAAEDMIRRRSGWTYAASEIRFYIRCYRLGFLSFFRCVMMIVGRVPLRFLPKPVLFFLFNRFLRK